MTPLTVLYDISKIDPTIVGSGCRNELTYVCDGYVIGIKILVDVL